MPVCYIIEHSFTRSVKNWEYFWQVWGQVEEYFNMNLQMSLQKYANSTPGLVVVECLHHSNPQSSWKHSPFGRRNPYLVIIFGGFEY